MFPILTHITVRLGLLFLVSAHRHPNRMKSHKQRVRGEGGGWGLRARVRERLIIGKLLLVDPIEAQLVAVVVGASDVGKKAHFAIELGV